MCVRVCKNLAGKLAPIVVTLVVGKHSSAGPIVMVVSCMAGDVFDVRVTCYPLWWLFTKML